MPKEFHRKVSRLKKVIDGVIQPPIPGDTAARVIKLRKQGVSTNDIAEALNLSGSSVRKHISNHLGKADKTDIPWTDEETQTLIDLRKQRVSCRVIGLRLNRNKNQVVGKVYRLRKEGRLP